MGLQVHSFPENSPGPAMDSPVNPVTHNRGTDAVPGAVDLVPMHPPKVTPGGLLGGL